MAKFIVCMEQWTRQLAEIPVEASSAREAAKLADWRNATWIEDADEAPKGRVVYSVDHETLGPSTDWE